MDKESKKMIGKSLQAARKAAGFKSAKAFAEHMEIETSRYTEYEQGRVSFSYETAWQMADALQCSMDELGGREWPPGGMPELSPDEIGLVDSYRRMDEGDRPAFMTTARGLAYAGEAKKEDRAADAPVAGNDVTEAAR